MRGLLCIEPLYKQIVLGNKTQTRRSGGLEVVNSYPDLWIKMSRMVDIHKLAKEIKNNSPAHYTVEFVHSEFGGLIRCSARYKVGEVLYLKEPILKNREEWKPDGGIIYKYSQTEEFRNAAQWSNKLFMPASAARAFIRITGIRCEHLLDINYSDAIAKGVDSMGYHGYKDYLKERTYELTAMESFFSLYKFANKVKEVPNLWVWVYEFEYLPNYTR